MRRKDLVRLYRTEIKTDPATGKKKRVPIYIGKRYRIKEQIRQGAVRRLWPCWAGALAAFSVGGLIPARAGNCTYVVVWYMACLLPLFYLLLGGIRMTRMKPPLTEIDLREGVDYVKNGAIGLTVLGGVWAMADAVHLLISGLPENPAGDLIFLACGVITAGMGWLISRKAAAVKAEEIKPEEITEKLEGERGSQP